MATYRKKNKVNKKKIKFKTKQYKYDDVVGILLLFCLLNITFILLTFDQNKKLQVCNDRLNLLNEQIQQQEIIAKELQEFEKYTSTTKYIEEVARDKLGLLYDNEIIFKGINPHSKKN